MRKLLKILAWIAGIVIVLVVVAIVVLKIFFPVEKVKQIAIERGTEALGRPIDIRTVDLSFWGGLGVELGEVTVANPAEMKSAVSDHLLAADYIDAKLALLPLITGEYRVDKLIVNNPAITLYKSPTGANNYTFETLEEKVPPDVRPKVTPEAKVASAAVSFERLEINDGRLSYVDDSTGGQASIGGLNLRTSLRNPRPNYYRSSGNLTVGELTVITDDTLPRIGFAIGYEAEYDYEKKQLLVTNGQLKLNGLKLDIEGSFSHGGEAIASRLSLQSEDVEVATLLDFLPPEQRAKTEGMSLKGRLSVDTEIDYDQQRDVPLDYNGTAQISDLTMSMRDVRGQLRFSRALVDFKQDNLRMNIENGSFDGRPLTGHLVVDDFDNPTVNGELAGTFNLNYVEPFLPAEGNHRIAGVSEFDIKFSGPIREYKTVDFSGEIVVTNGRYTSELLPLPLDSFSLDIYFDRNVAKVNRCEAYTPSGHVNIGGRVDDLVAYVLADSAVADVSPDFDGRLEGAMDLSVANPFLPPKGNPQMSGNLDINLNVVGNLNRLDNLKPRGSVVITEGSYRDDLLPEPVNTLNADLTLAPDTITVNSLAVAFESSDVSVTGMLFEPFPYLLPMDNIDRERVTKPLFQFKLSSSRFDVDRLFPEAVPGGGEQVATVSEDSISTIIFPDIDGRGSFTVDTLIYSRVEFTALSGKVEVHNRKIDVYDTKGKAYTGDVSGRTTIDLTDYARPRYVGEFDGDQLEVNDFITRFTRFGGHVFGKGQMHGTYNAAGWDRQEFLNSLTVDGKASLREGQLVTSGALYQALNGVAELVNYDNFRKEQPLRSLNTDIYVRDGQVGLDELSAGLGNIGDISVAGFYTFDGGLSYDGKIKLSQEWTDRLMSSNKVTDAIGGLLGGAENVDRITIPLAINGTLDKPKVNLDMSVISEKLKENLSEKAGDLLQGLFKKDDN